MAIAISLLATIPAQATLVGGAGTHDLQVSGSSTVWPISDEAAPRFITYVSTLGAPYNSITSVTHDSIGSGNGRNNWEAGTIDLAASSKPGSDSNIFGASYPLAGTVVNDPQEFALGRDSIAFIVPSTNTWISQISCASIDKIYTGVYTNWNQVPEATSPPDQTIKVIGRETTSGTFDGFLNFFLVQWGHSATNLVTGYVGETTNQQVKTDISGGSYPYAIAFIGLGLVDQVPTGIKVLNLFNPTTGTYIVPTIAHVNDGTYVASGGTFTTPKVVTRWLWYFMDGIPVSGSQDAIKSLWISFVKNDTKFITDNGYILMNRADMSSAPPANAGNPSTTVGTQQIPDRLVDYWDITYFITAYILYNGGSSHINPYADIAQAPGGSNTGPDGVIDYWDVTAFITLYIAANSS